MTLLRRALAPTLVLLVLLAGPAVAEGSGPRNQVITRNTTDEQVITKTKTRFTVLDESSDPVNLADARSSCRDCRNVAVAVQAIVFEEGASTSSPQNVAIALNYECSSCATFAAAYQRVWTTPGEFEPSDAAEERIKALRKDIDRTAASDLAFPHLDAELDRLVAELWSVIDAEVARAGETDDDEDPAETTWSES